MARPGNVVTGYLERVQDGPERQARFELNGTRARLGRGIRNNFILPHLTISRDHAEFQFSDNNWEIKDVSQNGISINYHRIASNIFVLLEHNDIISFVPEGQLDYRFVREGGTLQEDDHPEFGSPSMLSLPSPPSPQPSTSAAAINAQSARNNKRPPDDQRFGRGKQIRLEDGGQSVRSVDTHVLSQGQSSPTYSFLDSPGSSVHGGTDNNPPTSAGRKNPRNLNLEGLLPFLLDDAPSPRESSSQVHESDGTREQLEGQLLQVLEDEFNCVICSDVLIDPSVVECGHQFCSHCIQVWITERQQNNAIPNCPTCRLPVRSHRRLVSSTFLDRIYSLLSPAARENRQQILQQRQVEHEDWEAQQIARREAAQRARQDEMAESRRQNQADADARFHANRVRRYLYDNLLHRFLDQEADRAGGLDPNRTHNAAPNRADDVAHNRADNVSQNRADSATQNRASSAAPNQAPMHQACQHISAAITEVVNASRGCRAASSLGIDGFVSLGPYPNMSARLHNVTSMPNAQSSGSQAGQNAPCRSSSSAPRPNWPHRFPVFHTNPLSRCVLANYIRRRGTPSGGSPGSPTQRQPGGEPNVRHEQIPGSSTRSDPPAGTTDRPTERLPDQTENSATTPTTNGNSVIMLQMARRMPPPPAGTTDRPTERLPDQPANSATTPTTNASSAIMLQMARRMPPPARASAPSPVIIPGLANRPPSVSSIIDQRVPSPALSIASNSSALSDPFARAGGIPADPLERRSPAVVVVNPLIEIAANYGEPVQIRLDEVQEIQQEDIRQIQQEVVGGVHEGEVHFREENSIVLAPIEAEDPEPVVVRVRNVARRRRARPARPNSNNSDEVQMVGRVRRRSTGYRRRHGDDREQYLDPSEQRLLRQFMNYLIRPPSRSQGNGRRDEVVGDDEDDDIQIIEDDIQIIYEGL